MGANVTPSPPKPGTPVFVYKINAVSPPDCPPRLYDCAAIVRAKTQNSAVRMVIVHVTEFHVGDINVGRFRPNRGRRSRVKDRVFVRPQRFNAERCGSRSC